MKTSVFRFLLVLTTGLSLLLASGASSAVTGVTLKSKCKYIGIGSYYDHTHRNDDLGVTPDYDTGLCVGYIQGTVATLKHACGLSLTSDVLVQEVWQFLEDYPEKLTQHAGNLIIEALDKSPVCKPQSPARRHRSKHKKQLSGE